MFLPRFTRIYTNFPQNFYDFQDFFTKKHRIVAQSASQPGETAGAAVVQTRAIYPLVLPANRGAAGNIRGKLCKPTQTCEAVAI